MLQPECGGKEGLTLKSQGMQVSHVGEVWFDIITRVPQAQTKGCTASKLQGGCGLPAEGFTLSSSHWAPQEPSQPDTLMGPTVATMYVTHIVQDEATGVTYMDTVTALVGRVALGNPHMAANLQGLTMKDITDILWGAKVDGHPETEQLWQFLLTLVKTMQIHC